MPSRTVSRLVVMLALAAAVPALAPSALAQSGLRVPDRSAPGIDPTFARGWLAPEFDRFGFAYHWKDSLGQAPGQRMNWSYSFSDRSSLGLSVNAPRELDYDQRQFSVFGRYWFANDWAVSAETQWREPAGSWRPYDLRIGVQRRF